MSFVQFMRSIAGRLVRFIAGALIIWLALSRLEEPWSFLLAVIGLVPVVAGVFNFCLLGPFFHVDLRGRPRNAGPVR